MRTDFDTADIAMTAMLALAAIGFAGSLFGAFVGLFVPNPTGRIIALATPTIIIAAIVISGRLARVERRVAARIVMAIAALPGLASVAFLATMIFA